MTTTPGEPQRWDLTVYQGSWLPSYVIVRNPITGEPWDLTAAGFEARGVVATRPDGGGTVLTVLPDTTVLQRGSDGTVTFAPLPALTSTWGWRIGWHQIELHHPDTTKPVRIAHGRIRVSPELVTS